MIRKQVYITLYRIRIHPGAGHIEHHSPIGEPGRILDTEAVDGDGQRTFAGVNRGRKQLEKGLYAVEYAAAASADDADAPGQHLEPIDLGAERRIETEHDRIVG